MAKEPQPVPKVPSPKGDVRKGGVSPRPSTPISKPPPPPPPPPKK